MLVWLDAGFSWADTHLTRATENSQVAKYRTLACLLAHNVDRIVYATLGMGVPLPMWSANYDPAVRRHHEDIMYAIKEYIPSQIFVDDHWGT